ncbi:peptidylprolyl isomerase [Oscillospiraceae bacterium PP1C4]
MKKIALLLSAVLAMSMLFYGCGGKNAEPVPEEVPSASMPTTETDIIAHNLKIDESTISLAQFETPAAGAKVATIKTSAGDIKITFFPDEAPKAVENFLALAEKGYYNGLKFYQIVPSVHIATGDPDNTGNGGKSSFEDGANFEDEYSTNLWHFNGAVAMDNSGVPGTNNSRFYIVQNSEISDDMATKMIDAGFPEKVVNKYLEVGGVPNYDAKDTVFAQVIEGMDIVEQIAHSPRTAENKPEEDITITSVEIGTM